MTENDRRRRELSHECTPGGGRNDPGTCCRFGMAPPPIRRVVTVDLWIPVYTRGSRQANQIPRGSVSFNWEIDEGLTDL